jgi:hypothetical protein
MVITKETVRPVQTLISVCSLLVESAEAVGEGTADAEIRSRTFEYADKVKEILF